MDTGEGTARPLEGIDSEADRGVVEISPVVVATFASGGRF